MEAYEPEPFYERERELEPGARVLWGRVITLGVVLILVFLFGRSTAPEGVPRSELDDVRGQLASARAQIERLQAQPQAEPTPTPGTSPAASPTPQTSPAAAQTEQRSYTVRSGDTLRGIAQRMYGNANLASFLAEANGITDPTKLQVGKTLVIPPRPPGQ